MITGTIRYAHINAQVRSLASYLIGSDQWTELLNTASLPTFAEAAMELPYGRDIALPEPFSLGALDILFQQVVVREYEKFTRLVQGGAKDLLQELWRRFELDNLKAILRGVASSSSSIEGTLVPLEGSVLPVEDLQRAPDLQSVSAALADTIYGPPLSNSLPRYEAENTLFPVEVALDLAYWRRVWRAVRALGGIDKDWAKRLIGTRLDRVNVTWAFRYRLYHNLTVEEIINYTLPYGYRSDDDTIRAIGSGASMQDIARDVWGPDTVEFLEPEGEMSGSALQALEIALLRFECRQAKDAFSGYPFHLGVLLGYLMQKECEAHDLTALAEGKSERLSSEQIELHLISYGG